MSEPIRLGAENIGADIGLSRADIGADMRGADFTSVWADMCMSDNCF